MQKLRSNQRMTAVIVPVSLSPLKPADETQFSQGAFSTRFKGHLSYRLPKNRGHFRYRFLGADSLLLIISRMGEDPKETRDGERLERFMLAERRSEMRSSAQSRATCRRRRQSRGGANQLLANADMPSIANMRCSSTAMKRGFRADKADPRGSAAEGAYGGYRQIYSWKHVITAVSRPAHLARLRRHQPARCSLRKNFAVALSRSRICDYHYDN
jgi:hypothetical protein